MTSHVLTGSGNSTVPFVLSEKLMGLVGTRQGKQTKGGRTRNMLGMN